MQAAQEVLYRRNAQKVNLKFNIALKKNRGLYRLDVPDAVDISGIIVVSNELSESSIPYLSSHP